MTNAFPSTAPSIIVPNITLLMQINVNSIHRASCPVVVVVAVAAKCSSDEPFESFDDDDDADDDKAEFIEDSKIV